MDPAVRVDLDSRDLAATSFFFLLVFCLTAELYGEPYDEIDAGIIREAFGGPSGSTRRKQAARAPPPLRSASGSRRGR